MTHDLSRYCACIPGLSRWHRDPEQDRRDNIAALSDDIARLKAMQNIAADNPDFEDHERKRFAKEIVDIRRAIIATLSIPELTDIKAKGLQPEDALQIVRDPPKPTTDSAETAALKKQLGAERKAEMASRQYFVAEKGFAVSLQPGVGLSELAKHQRMDGLEPFKFPALKKVETATVVDAFANHNPTRRDVY